MLTSSNCLSKRWTFIRLRLYKTCLKLTFKNVKNLDINKCTYWSLITQHSESQIFHHRRHLYKKFIIKVYNHVDFILISTDLTKDKWRATKCFNYIFKQAFSVCDRKVGLKSKQLQLFNIKNWHSKLDVIHEIMIGRWYK